MANLKNETAAENEVVVHDEKDVKNTKPRKRLNPVVKWIAIGAAATVVVCAATYMIVTGKKEPVMEVVGKAAETAAEAMTA